MSADTDRHDVLFLQLPSPPFRDVTRDYAGGYGLTVRSPRARHGHGQATIPHLALVYAYASGLKRGMDVGFLDAQAEELDLPQLLARLRSIRPKVIVSSLSLPTMLDDLDVLRDAKDETDARVVACGTVCRQLTEEVFAGGQVDVAITGDVEATGIDVAERLLDGRPVSDVPGTAWREAGTVARTKGGRLTSLGELPPPPFERLPMYRYRNWEFGLTKRFLGREYGDWQQFFPLYLSHGCPFACHYCPYPVGHGTNHLVKDTEQSLDEFRLLAASGVRNVAMRDQVLPIEDGTLERFCAGLRKLGLGMRWTCEARVGSLEPGLLQLMSEAGCFRVHYGVETGDPDTFVQHAKRGIGPASVANCFDATKAAGMDPAAHFLLGFPEDSWTSVQRTVGLIDRLGIGSGDCSILTAYPGTAGFRRAEAEGRLLSTEWRDFTGSDPIIRVDGLSPVEMLVARSVILGALARHRKIGWKRKYSAVRSALKDPTVTEFGAMKYVQPFLADHLESAFRLAPKVEVGSSATGDVLEIVEGAVVPERSDAR